MLGEAANAGCKNFKALIQNDLKGILGRLRRFRASGAGKSYKRVSPVFSPSSWRGRGCPSIRVLWHAGCYVDANAGMSVALGLTPSAAPGATGRR